MVTRRATCLDFARHERDKVGKSGAVPPYNFTFSETRALIGAPVAMLLSVCAAGK